MRLVSRAAILLAAPLLFCCRMQEPKETQQLSRFVSVSLEKQPGMVSSEFIFEAAPFPSCHASTIAETKDGLIAAWFGGSRERNPDVCIWISRFVSGHWIPPFQVADGIQSPANRLPCWNP